MVRPEPVAAAPAAFAAAAADTAEAGTLPAVAGRGAFTSASPWVVATPAPTPATATVAATAAAFAQPLIGSACRPMVADHCAAE